MRFAVPSFLVMLTAAVTLAQPPVASSPTLAKVKGRAAVRAAPGDHSPETGALEPGTYLTVVGAEGNDWLAVQPPNGSISWIKWALVEPQGKPGADGLLSPPFNAVVRADNGTPAVLRAGAIGETRPLGVQRTKLPEGTVVRVIGAKAKVRMDGDEAESSWYPIVAPADDLRYVRRDAVEWTGTPASTSFVVKTGDTTAKPLPGAATEPVVRTGGTAGDWTLSVPNGGSSSAAKRDDWPNYHPSFRDAEKARGTGDVTTAEKLYRRVADEVSRDGPDKDVELANLCYDRIYLMKKGGGTSTGGDWTGGGTWRPSERSAEPPPAFTAPKAEPPRAERKLPEAAGYLKATKFEINRRPVYVLTDSKGRTTHYVASGGVDLERYVNKWVTVKGDETKPPELRGDPLLAVTQIADAR